MNTEDAPGAASFDPDEAIGKQSASSEQSKKKLSAKQVENTKAYFVNQKLEKARDTETILKLSTDEDLTPVNVATALHVLAKINKVRRAGRDALLRDSRYEALLDLVVADAEKFGARSVADVLWSCATLQHWPPTLLKPVLTAMARHLEQETFEGQHLSTMTWALARLECKPVRLLEQIEVLAIPRLGSMNVQNTANLLFGFAKLNYEPSKLLPELCEALVSNPKIGLASSKPVEVSDLAFALGMLMTSAQLEEEPESAPARLLLALAERASADAALASFSSRQLVTLTWCFAKLKMANRLPEGRLEEWISAIRVAHQAKTLMAQDARNLENSLGALGIDASWVKQSEILNAWFARAAGEARQGVVRAYTDEELRTVFDAIDTDNSGDIDLAELTAAIKAINPDADDEAVSSMLKFGDADGDEEVSFDEFKAIISQQPGIKEPAAVA